MPQELIVVGFEGTRRASDVIAELQKLNANWVLDLADAVAAYRTDDGQLRIDQSVARTRAQSADLGVLLHGMLGTLLTAPFAAGVNVAMDDVDQWKKTYGITDDFVSGVSQLVRPGHSAAFALISTVNPDVVVDHFRACGGKILRTALSPRQTDRAVDFRIE